MFSNDFLFTVQNSAHSYMTNTQANFPNKMSSLNRTLIFLINYTTSDIRQVCHR